MARPDPKLFIVWSSKYKYIAEQINNKLLDKRKTGFPIYPIMFSTGSGANENKNMFTTLIESMNSADYALILMTPDEEVLRRENDSIMGGFYATSRPNIYFEYGYLSKQLSTRKIFVYNTHGTMTASDISSLITNYMRIPATFDDIIQLPQKIVKDIEGFFRKKKEYYINLDQESYEIDYEEIFNDITKNNEYAEFIINKNINLGKYWRYELKRFPQDPYHIGRKIIYILERMPFNVYLYASPKSTSTIEQPQKFIDEDVFAVLKKDIDAFLTSIENPQEFRNYRLYMTCLNMLEIIEKYQVKRNDSPAFSFSNKNTYTEEANTLIDLEEYITHFPLSQMLFNRYLALSLHKNTIAIFNFEELNFDFKKKINDFFKEENDNYFISVIQISMALAYINKTIEMAEKYDNNNSIELHKSLALFDRARMEFLLEILLDIKVKDQREENNDNNKELLNEFIKLSTKPQNMEFIKKLAVSKTIKKLEKSFDYALIDFFDSILYKQHASNNETAFKNKFTIEIIKLISDKINSLILKEVNEEYKNIKLTGDYCHSQTESNDLSENAEVKDYSSNLYCEPIPNASEYYNEVNNIWRDSPYDIVIFNKSSLCKFICVNCSEDESKQEDNKKSKNELSLEQNIIRIIKNETSKLELSIDNEIIGIHMFNLKNKHQSLKECIKEICKNEFEKIQNDLFGNLEKHIEEYGYLGDSKKWERTMTNAEKIRYNMWNAARNWPPNMRSILLFEYYHALSDKYIYKINEIKSEFDNYIKNEVYNFINTEGQVQAYYDKNQYIIEELLKEKLYKPLQSIIANIQKKSGNKNNLFDYYLEYLECLSKLVEIKTKLDNATNVMESNYEIPDLSYNILKKIDGVLEKENDSTNMHERIFAFLKGTNDTEVYNK